MPMPKVSRVETERILRPQSRSRTVRRLEQACEGMARVSERRGRREEGGAFWDERDAGQQRVRSSVVRLDSSLRRAEAEV